jgi:hypothetical protein
MVPNDLSDWDYELIKKLTGQGYFETDKFDFKVDSPHKSDNQGKYRLEKSICAFANTEGGFLIFGIKDDNNLSLEDRILGIDPGRDFPREIGDKIHNIEPSVYYDFINPPIKVPNNVNVIHVIKIPQSPNRPHWTSKGEFCYRTNRGNVNMSYQQIKDSFLGEEIRRQKLRLLYIELSINKNRAESMLISEAKIDNSYTLLTLDSEVLQTLLVDTYPLIIKEDELISLLIQIRENITIINNEIKILFSKVSLPMHNMNEIISESNKSINNKLKILSSYLEKALKILEDKYDFN